MTNEQLVAHAEEEKEFVTLEDGFCYFWPATSGAFSSWMLRTLADELDRRNESWQKNIEDYFAQNES